jgi:hypothetical protein
MFSSRKRGLCLQRPASIGRADLGNFLPEQGIRESLRV